MRKLAYMGIAGVAVITLVVTCKKAYNPKVTDADTNILVVEGLINSGTDSTIIKLSRSSRIDQIFVDKTNANPELSATVTVLGDNNTTYPLKETSKGLYVSAGLKLDASHNYQLRVRTADGQEYLSDPEPVKVSPPVDSVGFNETSTGLTIYANTHDPANNTRYYRWTYDETWMFQVAYDSKYIQICTSDPQHAIPRTQPINYCFANSTSSDIVLASTTKLAQDVVEQAPITNISSSAEKLSIRYSILVKQYAISKAAYEFWENMKKNTESLGSIFDAQPSTAQGNVHCTSDPSKLAIGFVSVGTVQTKRIFIDKTDLRNFYSLPQNLCGITDTVYFKPPYSCYPKQGGGRLIVDMLYDVNYTPIALIETATACADCTTRGTLAKPSFWK